MSQTCLQQQRDAAAAAAASAGAYGPYSAMFHHATAHHSTAATADLYSRSCAAATGSGSGSAAAGSHSMGGYGSPPVTSAGSLGHPQGSSGTLRILFLCVQVHANFFIISHTISNAGKFLRL